MGNTGSRRRKLSAFEDMEEEKLEGFGNYQVQKMLVVAVLFFVLCPGVILTLPPGGRGVLFSGQTSLVAAAVHAVVFVLALRMLA